MSLNSTQKFRFGGGNFTHLYCKQQLTDSKVAYSAITVVTIAFLPKTQMEFPFQGQLYKIYKEGVVSLMTFKLKKYLTGAPDLYYRLLKSIGIEKSSYFGGGWRLPLTKWYFRHWWGGYRAGATLSYWEGIFFWSLRLNFEI
ncbi:hypothetical protein NQ317_000860 [Molorchus minor]|uniref:Uncharacterized protein n=1 Tax=Molorchus minor TaxID=1323400 RepID=A0ABQ9JVA2_9CUCU|nr:hypothetical protein NQ317_000860 [Molorchus minor]